MNPRVKYMKSLADILPRRVLATVQSWLRSFCWSSSLIYVVSFIPN